MRKLIILRGAPGVGKSTFIKENHLEKYTLCSDTFRLLLNAPELTTNGQEKIPQHNNKLVWNLLYYILEERMKKGEFTIIDAVHKRKEDFSLYKKLALKYRYRTYVIDFTSVPIEEVFKRNEGREEYKKVPKESILAAYKYFAKEELAKSFQILNPMEFSSVFTTKPIDRNNYKNIHVLGDIHGCVTPLKMYFENHPWTEEDAYIFLGDYLDRGIKNYETYLFLKDLSAKENCFFLLGNHEDKLYKYACDDPFTMDLSFKRTIEELEKEKVSKTEIRGWIKQMAQLAYITFRGKNYLLTHGGIPYFPKKPLDFYSTNSFVYGTLSFDEDIDKIYQEYMEKEKEKVYQIHGHRNFFHKEIDAYPYSYNLEGGVEEGEFFRVLNLEDNGHITFLEYKNAIYNPNLQEEINVYHLIETARDNKYIYEKELGNHISSFNFTKEAFYNHVWNDCTTKARGLFINTKNYKIVARSYDKFFQIGERKETKLEVLQESLEFPVQVYEKYNGFLGLLSVYEEELFFATKSTNAKEYVTYFKDIFYEKLTAAQIEQIKEKCQKENVTMLFEVLDPFHDPHIIKYENTHVILLDIVKNKTTTEKVEYEELKSFAEKNHLEIKKHLSTIKNKEELQTFYKEITSDSYKFTSYPIEGVILEDNHKFMTKVKTKYYNKWKYLRTLIEKKKWDVEKLEEEDREFLLYVKEKYKDKEVNRINIILEREEFWKHK